MPGLGGGDIGGGAGDYGGAGAGPGFWGAPGAKQRRPYNIPAFFMNPPTAVSNLGPLALMAIQRLYEGFQPIEWPEPVMEGTLPERPWSSISGTERAGRLQQWADLGLVPYAQQQAVPGQLLKEEIAPTEVAVPSMPSAQLARYLEATGALPALEAYLSAVPAGTTGKDWLAQAQAAWPTKGELPMPSWRTRRQR